MAGFGKAPFAAIAAVAMFFCGCVAAREEQKNSVSRPKAIVIGGFESPESVTAVRGVTSVFFVSNMGKKLEPGAKDGDGFISKLFGDGRAADMHFLPKPGSGQFLNSPKGITVLRDVLYVADVDRLVGFDINTRKKVFELDFSHEGTAFLNDPVAVDVDTLLVSATDVGKIYEVSLHPEPSYKTLLSGIDGANGLYYDSHGQLVFVVSFGPPPAKGSLGVISFKGGEPVYERLAADVGLLDGVAFVPGVGVVFSDWAAFDKPGRLLVYRADAGGLTELELSEDVRGPADFFYDAETGNLWLPRMMEGKIQIEKLGR